MDTPKALLGFTFAYSVSSRRKEMSHHSSKSLREYLSHMLYPKQSLWLEDAMCLFWGCNVLIDLSLGLGWSQLPQDHRDPQPTRERLARENACWE